MCEFTRVCLQSSVTCVIVHRMDTKLVIKDGRVLVEAPYHEEELARIVRRHPNTTRIRGPQVPGRVVWEYCYAPLPELFELVVQAGQASYDHWIETMPRRTRYCRAQHRREMSKEDREKQYLARARDRARAKAEARIQAEMEALL